MFDAATARQRIIQRLFLEPSRDFTLSDLARAARVAKSTSMIILRQLADEGLARIVTGRPVWRIAANQESLPFQQEKILFNLANVFRSGLPELLDEAFQKPKAIVLFGSYRRGEDDEDSDVDIAIELTEPLPLDPRAATELDERAKRLRRRISLHPFTRKDVDPNLFANIANGIVLLGFLEARP